ncbi:transposase [Streptomyces pristinaespiralis]
MASAGTTSRAHLAAKILITEIGGDMAEFASAHRLMSWIGVCPGQNESAT